VTVLELNGAVAPEVFRVEGGSRLWDSDLRAFVTNDN
jgi:hypothetical protein